MNAIKMMSLNDQLRRLQRRDRSPSDAAEYSNHSGAVRFDV
ncbi:MULTISPECIES: hypothetical protein [Cyanophyceae]|nr:hypothetical protein [Trichocoleus sp. FACHB-69]